VKRIVLSATMAAGGVFVSNAYAADLVLYGIVDGGVQYQSVEIDNVGKAEKTGMHSGGRAGNRWGLRGSEDLGDGLKAIFTLENGFMLETGDVGDARRRSFNRQAYLGLSSEHLGTLTFGRQYNIGFFYLGSIGPFGNGFSLASRIPTFSSAVVRYDNLFKYETPIFGGFQAAIGYSNDTGFGSGTPWEVSGREDAGGDSITALTLGMHYTQGPLKLAVNYDRLQKVPSSELPGAETGSIQVWNAGVSYDLQVLRLDLAYGQDIDGRIAASNANVTALGNMNPMPNVVYDNGFKTNNYQIGLSTPIGNGRILAAWQMSSSNLRGETVAGNGVGKQQSLSLGYLLDFSKRTSFYAHGTYMKNPAYIDGAKSQEYRIGLNHKF